MDDIAFLAVAQVHQHLHWLPAALRLAREPGVRVTVLASSRAGIEFVRGYDPEGILRLRWLPTPSLRRDGLFTPPKRRLTLLLYHREIGRFSTIVTTETTSAVLRRVPGFRSRMIHLKHGAGDREGGYNPKHAAFDLTLVNGPKDKQRLIERGLGTDANVKIVGYAKFELAPTATLPPFADDLPLALYNPHFDPAVSSWFAAREGLVQAMASISGWNFVIAPHVKLKRAEGPGPTSGNIFFDPGSRASIDSTYTEAASIYIGDVSSQVYEFLRRPRPCIFINTHRVDWRGDEHYAHWHLGQVIERPEELGPALERAAALQPVFEPLQREATKRSLDPSPEPASERQARAILDFVRNQSL
ncbi:MAG TPA: glycosyl transferase [Sphingomicrobium sp.]|nr:glycosyl transferase [Sphingomicrobium sp.]